MPAAEWLWNPALGVYYHPSGRYALPSTTGEWTYLTPDEFATMPSKSANGAWPSVTAPKEKEDGEVEDDVGWGGLMEPDKLARVVASSSSTPHPDRHPAYGVEPRPDPYGRLDELYPDDREKEKKADLLRLVVYRSKALPLGGVAVLDTREGGIQIGRDRPARGDPPRLRVREMEVSKSHCLIYYGRAGVEEDEEEGWHLVDLGSTLGTYVAHRGVSDATRLSEAKHSSKPYPIRHLSRLTVGTTTFAAHVHEDWPCGECQIAGTVEIPLVDGEGDANEKEGMGSPAPSGVSGPVVLDAAQRRGQQQFNRKRELDALRGSLLGDDPRPRANGYVDRSAQRRKLHPPSPPRERPSRDHTPTYAPSAPAGPSEAGRALLAKQGWTPGSGLGRSGEGRAEALVPTLRAERAGLGARGAEVEKVGERGDWKEKARMRRWNEVSK